MKKNRTFAIRLVVIIAVLLAVIGSIFAITSLRQQKVSTDEPVDIVQKFYRTWLDTSLSTTTDPYKEGLENYPFLSKELRTKIREAKNAGEGLDPVLCQTVVPADIALRIVSETESRTELLVTARESASTEQAIITVLPLKGGWYIDDIRCSPGEFTQEREFSFDKEGNLLKSVPEPLNAEYWHLVFQEDGIAGHYAPLFFGPESVCVSLDGNAGACDPDTFTEATKVHVQGEMTDLGVAVKRLERTQ